MNPDHPAFNARVFRVALKLCREEIERHNEEIAQLQAEARELVEKQS